METKEKKKMGRPPLGKKMAHVGLYLPQEIRDLLGENPSKKAQEIILNYFKNNS